MTFVTCDDKLTWEALVKLLVQVSSDGCTAANTIQSVAQPWQWDDNSDLQWDDDSTVDTD